MGEAEDRWRDEEGEGQLGGWGVEAVETQVTSLTLSSASSLGEQLPSPPGPEEEETSDWRRKTQQSCLIRLMKAVIHPSVPSCSSGVPSSLPLKSPNTADKMEVEMTRLLTLQK